jgi:hypothetical protein
MLPPSGVSYYEREMREKGARRKAVAQPKIVCPRCGHWHHLLGLDFDSGFMK